MGAARKVFRIEQSAAARLEPSVEASQAGLHYAEIARELAALRAAIAAAAASSPQTNSKAPGGETGRLTSELNLIAGAIRGGESESLQNERVEPRSLPASRISHELSAVVNGTELATQKILGAAEDIDSAANSLSAALDGRHEQDLAQDIQDMVIQIFEACNFQDLIGQRLANVMATLKFVEEHITCVLDEIQTASAAARHNGAQALHGPRLDGDAGHVTQDEVDAMFISRR